MTIPRIIGKLICSLRARFGARPVHEMRRVTLRTPITRDDIRVGTASATVRRCTRCGHTAPIRKRKASQ